MSALSKLKDAFSGAPPLDPFEQQRLDAFDRRQKLSQKVDSINAKIKAVAAERAGLDDAPTKLQVAESAYSDAVVASETGQPVPIPLETLKTARDTARQTAADAQDRANDLDRVLAAYRTQLEPLRDAQQAIRRELDDLAPYVLDARLTALKARHDAAEAEMRAVLELEARLTLAFDAYAMSTARGTFRGSAAYNDIRIPRPDHPAYQPQFADAYERGRALSADHEAHREQMRARDRAAKSILADVLHGT